MGKHEVGRPNSMACSSSRYSTADVEMLGGETGSVEDGWWFSAKRHHTQIPYASGPDESRVDRHRTAVDS